MKKRYNILMAAVLLLGMSSCAMYRCPTYSKKAPTQQQNTTVDQLN